MRYSLAALSLLAASLTTAAPVDSNAVAARDPVNSGHTLSFLSAEGLGDLFGDGSDAPSKGAHAGKAKRAPRDPVNADAILKFLSGEGNGDELGDGSDAKAKREPVNADAILAFLAGEGNGDELGDGSDAEKQKQQ
ncbi:Nicotinate phosphoribosyltransferase [Neofusicoccum parvum]|uniref:Nicotinate phosphoribosyltransferase n=1 Tax=Neofusicoccum parvum TaxID=310453 RepID=A0ACB5SKW2_9PEZI|nr:Nicotinate phosphoribosyltransferase [Neofusicoccum parvum]